MPKESRSLYYKARLAMACSFNLPSILPNKIRPSFLDLNLTENCQSKCVTCDYWKTKWEDRITTNRAVELLQEAKALGIQNLRFTGGEPLLRKDLFEILGSLQKGDFKRIILATNGLLIPKYHHDINNSVITDVTVSLDGVGANYDEIRGVKGGYNKITKALPLLKKQIRIMSTFTNRLVGDLEEIIALCEKNSYVYGVNIPDTALYFFDSPKVKQQVASLAPSDDDIEKGMAILREKGIMQDYLISNARKFMRERKFEFNHCILGYIETIIDSKGDVRSGCNVFKPVGNILDQPLGEVLKHRDYLDSVGKMFNLDCGLCSCGFGTSAMYSKPWYIANFLLSSRKK